MNAVIVGLQMRPPWVYYKVFRELTWFLVRKIVMGEEIGELLSSPPIAALELLFPPLPPPPPILPGFAIINAGGQVAPAIAFTVAGCCSKL